MAPHINFYWTKTSRYPFPNTTCPSWEGGIYLRQIYVESSRSIGSNATRKTCSWPAPKPLALPRAPTKWRPRPGGSSEQNSDQLLVVGRFFERSLLYNSLRQTHKNHVHVFFGVSFLIFVIVTVKSFESMCHQHLPIIYQPHQVSPKTFRLMKECSILFRSHQVQPATEDDMFAEPGQHFCGSGRLQEASAMLGGNFLGSRMVQIPWKWLCWMTSLVGKLRFVWCHKSFSKKNNWGLWNFASPSHLVCSGAYARDMGVWSLVNNFCLEVSTKVSVEKNTCGDMR